MSSMNLYLHWAKPMPKLNSPKSPTTQIPISQIHNFPFPQLPIFLCLTFLLISSHPDLSKGLKSIVSGSSSSHSDLKDLIEDYSMNVFDGITDDHDAVSSFTHMVNDAHNAGLFNAPRLQEELDALKKQWPGSAWDGYVLSSTPQNLPGARVPPDDSSDPIEISFPASIVECDDGEEGGGLGSSIKTVVSGLNSWDEVDSALQANHLVETDEVDSLYYLVLDSAGNLFNLDRYPITHKHVSDFEIQEI